MSLTNVDFWEVVKKQLRFKLKSYRGIFTSLMLLQIIGMLISFAGEGGGGGGSDTFQYELTNYSSNFLFGLMVLWAFISAIVITTQAYRFDDFTFVTNRLSSHISNILFLGMISAIGGATFLLASQSLKLVLLFIQEVEILSEATLTSLQLAAGLSTVILYLFLFSAFGYLIGMLVQRNKLFVILLPAGLFGLMLLPLFLNQESQFLNDLVRFFGEETSFMLFTIKVLLTSLISFGLAIWFSNRMEVRQ